ncbi:cytochrome P450 [Acrodontium crateriforme]|uniref:Cytochrome P450 n=1 Tax=Acrodontium crateriforme TaxID=150365 RepID=A0AAQ3R6R6_9PEZI|nr:cytochrome P450 [Acrodontium crateriforme]
MKTRDRAVILVILSAIESYLFLHFRPEWRPLGGIGRLVERFFIANLVLWVGYAVLIYPYFVSHLRKLPSVPGGYFLTGNLLEVRLKQPQGEAVRQWMEKVPNEGLIHFREILGRDALIPTNGAMLKTILHDNNYDYHKPSRLVDIIRLIIGDGLISVEGDMHKFQRKHLLPSFQVKAIRDLYPMFWAKSCELTHRLKEASKEPEIEFGVWCTRVTLDIIGIAGFGRDFESLKNPDDPFVKDYQDLLEPALMKTVFFTMALFLPKAILMNIPFWHIPKNLSRISGTLNEFAYNMCKDRRAELNDLKLNADDREQRKDILSLLIKSNDFTDRELSYQVLTMMGAGHETTSSTLSWCTYLLAQNPEYQNRLRAEVRKHLPSPDNIATENITAAAIDNLPLLHGITQETLRLYPTVPVTLRVPIKETILGDSKLSAGTMIMISPWAINRNTEIWGKGAQEFIPERWIDEDGRINNSGGATNNYSQMTFLHGPRSCIGQGFSRSELKCLLAALVWKYNMQLTRDKDSYYPAGVITTKPANGMWIKFTEIAD